MVNGLDLKTIPVILALLSLIPAASALDIGIGINEEIKGNLFDMKITAGPPQKHILLWANTGSVDCQSRARVEIYNTQDQRVFTAWSHLERLSPSQEAEFRLYSNLPPGQYTLRIRVYHCNEVFDQNPVNLTITREPEHAGSIDFVSYSVREGFLDVSVRSSHDLENVAIVPEGFPAGWVFSQGFIESLRAGEAMTATIPLEPSVWIDRKVTLSAFSENGEYHSQKEIVIRKQEPTQDNTSLYLLIVIAAVVIISFLYHTRKKLLWKRQ
jgi:hypothetical protein